MTVNRCLIFFKRLKGLIERLTGCCIYGQMTAAEVKNGSVQVWADERKALEKFNCS